MDGLVSAGMSLDGFVRQHALTLTRFAFLLTGDRGRGEDLVQEVLFAMHRRFGPQLSIEDPLRYARRSIVNAHISVLRRRRVVELLSDDLPEVPTWDVSGAEAADDELWLALTTLPPRQRTVLVLRYYVGHTDAEIADLLGCRESSVRSLATRAFKTLRPMLRPAGNALGAAQ